MQEIFTDGDYRHRAANPNTYRQGDIMEAQIAFIAIPTGKGKFRLRLVLRALSVEDSSLAEVKQALYSHSLKKA